MAERGADPRRDREHRRDAGHDGDIERAPIFRSGLDFLADRGGHGEDAGIAAGNDGNARALRGMTERRGRARALFAIVGSVAALARAHRHAIEIGPVTIKRVCGGERRVGLRREIAGVARAQPNDGEVPAHGRCSQPGTNTTAK